MRSAEAPRPADTPSAPVKRCAKIEVEEKRELAPEEAVVKEEWAPGRVVPKVEGWDGSWLIYFPCSDAVFLLFFLTGGWGPDDYRPGRSGAREKVL